MNEYSNKIKIDYFVSWIANFGVVPLFRSILLRLFPLALFFLRRISSVCFVLEGMKFLLSLVIFQKETLLPGPEQKVKIFLILLQLGLAIPAFSNDQSPVSPNDLLVSELPPTTILLGLGEHRQLILPKLERFSVSNKDCLSYKFGKFGQKKGELWILAKKTGFSEIVGQDNKGLTYKLQVYILSKRDQLKLQEVAQSAELAGWKTSWVGHNLSINGKIRNFNDYLLAHQISVSIKERGLLNLSFEDEVAKDIIVSIYRALFENWVDYFRCTYAGMSIECSISESNPPSASLLKTLSDKYLVQFRPVADSAFKKNYRAKLRFFQLTRADGQYFDVGMENLTTSLGSLFNRNALKQLIRQNDVLLQNENVELGLLAEPEVTFQLGDEIEIKLGDEIPYQTYNTEEKSTSLEWKFSGLQFRFKLLKVGEKFQMHYLVSYNRSNENGSSAGPSSLQQSKEEASLFVDSKKPTQLFQVGMIALDHKKRGIPGLSSIPLLGRAFREEGKSQVFKRVSALFMLEEEL
ncbi:MAG: hypothetical protein A2X86_18680 [Bdellovibrionales bacterium GWA2_49_15]|nr:MAG: hypothetical protein A2X86_18680 [Bdellovibrionales bacterium GWA2_49_15]HAZ14253.1 hypothetical protein [Bdellovibrionales bacterium]